MKFKIQNSKFKIKNNFKVKTLIKILLENRGIKTKKEVEEFLNPKLSNITINNLAINLKQLNKAVLRIKDAIKKEERIVVFGDYDVDGICGTAILWETLNSLGAKVMPYIPHRIDEGYGLSIAGINNVMDRILHSVQDDNKKGLIITVDNGIVANKAVEFAKKQGIDVIITDHHVPSRSLPKAFAIVHTTKLCGTGVAWMLSSVILNTFSKLSAGSVKNLKRSFAHAQDDNWEKSHLELVALATVADLVPLKGANRTLLKFGLEALGKTKRIGILELLKEAGLEKQSIGVYEIGHMIAPRLNATGRLDYAMDSLRLLCTSNKKRAEILAKEIGTTNRERQLLTINTAQHAIESVKNKKELKKLLFVVHESYQQGVIGLIAGKLVEEFYRPAIVISKGKKYSKASARSIKGFDIIEFIRSTSEFLVDSGGHPMAAGFTIETEKIPSLEKFIDSKIESLVDEQFLIRKLRIDCELPLSFVNTSLHEALQALSPFGMGNPEPTFISKGVVVEDMRLVGAEGKHLKLRLTCHPERSEGSRDSSPAKRGQNDRMVIEGIGFGMGEKSSKISISGKVDIVYTIAQDEWLARRSLGEGGNGEKRLQLKLKDIMMTQANKLK